MGAGAALLMAATLPVVMAGAAYAGDDEVIRRGACSGSTDWKMKAKTDDGGPEVEAEIDSNHSGQDWRWVLRRNGNVVDRGTSTTHGASGSFEVERHTPNGSGTDSFRFRARHQGSDEVCVGRVRF